MRQMTTVNISPSKHIFLNMENPDSHKVTRICTAYTAEDPKALEKVAEIKEKLTREFIERKRYLIFSHQSSDE